MVSLSKIARLILLTLFPNFKITLGCFANNTSVGIQLSKGNNQKQTTSSCC